MSIWSQTATSRGEDKGDYELPPEGNQPARIVALVDLGTHRREYQGKVDWKRKVAIVWELVDVESRPLMIKDFTLSLHENALLRAWVDSWRGKSLKDGEGFELTDLLGTAGMADVEHATSKSNKTFARLKGVSPLPRLKGKPVEVEEPENEPVAWSIDDDKPLPSWLPYLYGRELVKHVAESQERTGEMPEPEGEQETTEQIPF